MIPYTRVRSPGSTRSPVSEATAGAATAVTAPSSARVPSSAPNDTSIFAADVGWRIAFGVGAVLGLTIMLVRRNVPESPRWLFIHGHQDEAERIVDDIEQRTTEETGQELPEPESTITVRQRETIPFRVIARTSFKVYPRRAVLGLAVFVGQAFIYNGVTFNLGTLFTTFYDVSSSVVPLFVVVYAIGNFLGPLTLGRLFDTVGRKPMIVGTYLGSAAVAAVMAVLFLKRLAVEVDARSVHRGHVRSGLGGSECRLSDRQRDIPDGDARAGDRVLHRCGGDGARRHRGRSSSESRPSSRSLRTSPSP
jgi:MFS family permease